MAITNHDIRSLSPIMCRFGGEKSCTVGPKDISAGFKFFYCLLTRFDIFSTIHSCEAHFFFKFYILLRDIMKLCQIRIPENKEVIVNGPIRTIKIQEKYIVMIKKQKIKL